MIRLIRELAKINKEVNVLLNPSNVITLTKIEDAYIGSRYLPRRYLKEEVKANVRFR